MVVFGENLKGMFLMTIVFLHVPLVPGDERGVAERGGGPPLRRFLAKVADGAGGVGKQQRAMAGVRCPRPLSGLYSSQRSWGSVRSTVEVFCSYPQS